MLCIKKKLVFQMKTLLMTLSLNTSKCIYWTHNVNGLNNMNTVLYSFVFKLDDKALELGLNLIIQFMFVWIFLYIQIEPRISYMFFL